MAEDRTGRASVVAMPYPRTRRRAPATSWWGRAWTRSVEELAYEPDDVVRARTLARSGRFGAIAVEPGLAAAVLTETDGSTLLVRLQVEQLSDRDWDDFAAEVARHAGHVADLLAGELTPALVEAADEVGVEVLPGADVLDAACGCEAWAQPCVHALGLATQLAWLVDQDPFCLLLLRGCSRERLLGLVTGGSEPADDVERPGPGSAAERAAAILALAQEAPAPSGGLADAATASYDEQVARLVGEDDTPM